VFVCFSVDLVLSSHIVHLILARARVLAMARCLSVCLCPSVRPSQVGVLSKRMDGQSCFLAWSLLSTYPVVCFRAYSKRVSRTNCALRIKKCAPRISSGIYFLSTSYTHTHTPV